MNQPVRLKSMDLAAHVGEEMGVSNWITLDQSRINEFAHCTEDNQWIHVDVERATRVTLPLDSVSLSWTTRWLAGVGRRASFLRTAWG